MKTLIINICGLAIVIAGAMIAAYVLLYLVYFAIIISLFYPKLIYVFGLGTAALIAFSVARSIYRPKNSYRLKR